ncbi:hypothetical protein [Sphingomonas sp. ID0503]
MGDIPQARAAAATTPQRASRSMKVRWRSADHRHGVPVPVRG